MAWLGTPFTDLSGAIATGGTSQPFAAADTSRRYLRITNPSAASESLWVNDKGVAASAADGKSFEITAGERYEWLLPPTTAVSVVSATTGHKFEGAGG